MVSFGAKFATAAILGATTVAALFGSDCVPADAPNAIFEDHPFEVSGNLNGSTIIIPISLETAREVIPAEYEIIEGAYRKLLPDFPDGMYPMMVVTVHDHDLRLPFLNLSVPDFTRASLEFPFLDLLGDGYTSFRLSSTMLLTKDSPAIAGSEGYGIKVYPAEFEPECDAYQASSECGGTSFKAVSVKGEEERSMEVDLKPSPGKVPYDLNFIKNITNQVVFAKPTICDNYKRLFNSSLSAAPFEPVPVKGTVTAMLEPFPEKQTWEDVYGWRMATAFLEPPVGAKCELFQGYKGTGTGDSTEF